MTTDTCSIKDRYRAFASHLYEGFRVPFRLPFKAEDLANLDDNLAIICAVHDVKVEKLLKWFTGNMLAWITSLDSIIAPPFAYEKEEHGDLNNIFRALKFIFPRDLYRTLRKRFLILIKHARPEAPLNRKKRKALSIGQSLLMIKKGTPLVSEDMVIDSHQKHMKGMTSEEGFELPPFSVSESSWGEHTEIRARDRKVKKQIDRIVRRLFKADEFHSLFHREMKFPSASAHHDFKSESGGALRYVAETFKTLKAEREPLSSEERPIHWMKYHPRTGVVDIPPPRDYSRAYDKIFEDVKKSNFPADPVYLLEPLKVRTITKGGAAPYFALKPLQDLLWGGLARWRVTRLAVQPLDEDILNQTFQRELRGHEFYVSGDYSAATDNMNQRYTRYIWNAIAARTGMPNFFRRTGSKCLVGHTLFYKDPETGERFSLKQKNGQLMGSPISFPILCIANAAVCTAEFPSWMPLNDLPVLCNGDDCVMRYSQEQYTGWGKSATMIGMKPSPGKCYQTLEWLQMNSQLYLHTQDGFEYIPFINLSLASPMEARGSREREWTTYSSLLTAFLKGHSPSEAEYLKKVWLSRMAPSLKAKVPSGMSWYLPVHLGGLGLTCLLSYGELRERLSKPSGKPQLALASMLYDQIMAGKAPRIPSALQVLHPWMEVISRKMARFQTVLPLFEGEYITGSEHWKELQKVTGSSLFPVFMFEELNSGRSLRWGSDVRAVQRKSLSDSFWSLQRRARKLQSKGKLVLHRLDTLLALKGYKVILPQEDNIKRLLALKTSLPKRLVDNLTVRERELVEYGQLVSDRYEIGYDPRDAWWS